MADSIQKRVVDYVVAALSAAGAPAPVFRTRTESFSAAQMPAYNVYPLHGAPYDENATTGTLGQRFGFAVAAMASGSGDVDVALDPLFVWAWQAILADPTLGGLVLDTQLEIWDWSFAPADTDISICLMTFTALLAVKRTDPTASGLNF